jgi:hypothetical protein
MQKVLAWIRRQTANQQDVGIEGENTRKCGYAKSCFYFAADSGGMLKEYRRSIID